LAGDKTDRRLVRIILPLDLPSLSVPNSSLSRFRTPSLGELLALFVRPPAHGGRLSSQSLGMRSYHVRTSFPQPILALQHADILEPRVQPPIVGVRSSVGAVPRIRQALYPSCSHHLMDIDHHPDPCSRISICEASSPSHVGVISIKCACTLIKCT
jgi:hypothetical protein